LRAVELIVVVRFGIKAVALGKNIYVLSAYFGGAHVYGYTTLLAYFLLLAYGRRGRGARPLARVVFIHIAKYASLIHRLVEVVYLYAYRLCVLIATISRFELTSAIKALAVELLKLCRHILCVGFTHLYGGDPYAERSRKR
jgi:hypothetical protein